MSGHPASLRILLHKPLRRVSEPYFRVQQYANALARLGHRAESLDFGRLHGGAVRRATSVIG